MSGPNDVERSAGAGRHSGRQRADHESKVRGWPTLYAVEFEVDRRADGRASSPYAFALADLAKWVASRSEAPGKKPDFRAPGRCELHRSVIDEPSTVRWEPARGPQARVVRLEICTQTVHGWLATDISVHETAGRASIRIAASRAPTTADPTADPTLGPERSPAADLVSASILKCLLADHRIALRVGHQDQTGHYSVVRSTAAVEALVRSLQDNRRLPAALFHTRTLPALAAAQSAATRLVGLASVVTLDLRATVQLEDLLPGCSPTYASARLLWSDLNTPSITVAPNVVNGETAEEAGSQLMHRLVNLAGR